MKYFNLQSKTSNYTATAKAFCAALLSISFFVLPSQAVFAQVMSSGSYQIQSDSMNFAGTRSTSGSYALEDAVGETGTGYSNSTNQTTQAGFEQASGNVAVNPTTPQPSNPNVAAVSKSGNPATYPGQYSFVNAINFVATPGDKTILLTWQYPGQNVSSVRIVRSDKFFPFDINDGDVIFEGNVEGSVGQVIDHDIKIGTRYYYALFTKNAAGEYSSGVLTQTIVPSSVTPASPNGTNISTQNIFETIPQATYVDPAISALTFDNFIFIQDGRKIEHAGDTVAIDGNQNLTIQLDYASLPEVLKTIAISLTDPNDSTKIFTFLLRVNKGKTAYEATIAPLGASGNYKLNAIIIDYKNQGLKKIAGNLKALVLKKGANFFGFNTKDPLQLYAMIGFLALAFIAIIVFVEIERNKAKKARIMGTQDEQNGNNTPPQI